MPAQVYTITIHKQPTPKQSTRFGNGHAFLADKVKHYMECVTAQIVQQLPKGFEILSGPIKLTLLHTFPVTAVLKTRLKKSGNPDALCPKISRPDVTDNLNKGVIDAMSGIVFYDDAQIWDFRATKVYGKYPQTIITFAETNYFLDETNFSLIAASNFKWR